MAEIGLSGYCDDKPAVVSLVDLGGRTCQIDVASRGRSRRVDGYRSGRHFAVEHDGMECFIKPAQARA